MAIQNLIIAKTREIGKKFFENLIGEMKFKDIKYISHDPSRSFAELTDGTTYEAYSVDSCLRGKKFDRAFIDESIDDVEILNVIYNTLLNSRIPEDYRTEFLEEYSFKQKIRLENEVNGANSNGFVHNPASFKTALFNGSEIYTLNSDIINIKGKRASMNFYEDACGLTKEEICNCLEEKKTTYTVDDFFIEISSIWDQLSEDAHDILSKLIAGKESV